MTIAKLRRCKRIIASPNYYRDRAIQMEETAADHWVEYHLRYSTADGLVAIRYERKAMWYIRQARAFHYDESMDYQS